jgi:hypothetical protein
MNFFSSYIGNTVNVALTLFETGMMDKRLKAFLTILLLLIHDSNAATLLNNPQPFRVQQILPDGSTIIAEKSTVVVQGFLGENIELQALTNNTNHANIRINLQQVEYTIPTLDIGFVPQNGTQVNVASAHAVNIIDNSNPRILLNAFNRYLTENDFTTGPGPNARRSTKFRRNQSQGTVIAELVSSFGAAALSAGLGGDIGAAVGFSVLGIGLGTTLGLLLTDNSYLEENEINKLLESGPGWSQCETVIRPDIGSSGFKGCISRILEVLSYDWTQIDVLQRSVVNIQQAFNLIEQDMFQLTGRVTSLTSTTIQLTQQIQGVLNIQAQGAAIDQNTQFAISGLAADLAFTTTNADINFQNLQKQIGLAQEEHDQQVAFFNNNLQQFTRVTKASITLSMRTILARVGTSLSQMAALFESERQFDVLNTASQFTQIENQLTADLNTLQTVENQIAAQLQLNAAIVKGLRDVVNDATTLQQLPGDVHMSFDYVYTKYQKPFVLDIGNPPFDPTIPKAWDHRNYNVTVTQKCNNITGHCNSCTAIYENNDWQAAVYEKISTQAVVTFNVPTIANRNYVHLDDAVILQVLDDGGVWRNLTNNDILCSSCVSQISNCPLLNQGVMCPNKVNATIDPPGAADIVVFRLQSYDRYTASRQITCTNHTVVPVIGTCVLVGLNPSNTTLTYTCPTYSSIGNGTCNYVYSGTHCDWTEYFLLNLNGTLNGTCTTANLLGCTVPFYETICTEVNITSTFGPSLVAPGTNIYLSTLGADAYNRAILGPTSPTTSAGFCVGNDSTSYVIPSQVFQVNLFNLTLQNSGFVSAINNTIPVTLTNAQYGPLVLNPSQCFTSTSVSSPTPAQFRIIPYYAIAGGIDVGNPQARRSIPEVNPIAEPSTKSKRAPFVAAPPDCGSLKILNLVDQPNEYNVTAIDMCTAMSGCILARIPRKDQVLISDSYGRSTTLHPGTYLLNLVTHATNSEFGKVGWQVNGVDIVGASTDDASDFTYGGFNMTISAGLLVHIRWNQPGRAGIGTSPTVPPIPSYTVDLYIESTVPDIAFQYGGYLLPFVQTLPNDGWFSTLVSISVEYAPDYTFNYMDVCIPDIQSDGSSLLNGVCSFTNSKPTSLTIPTLYNYQFYSAVTSVWGGGTMFAASNPIVDNHKFVFWPPGTPAPAIANGADNNAPGLCFNSPNPVILDNLYGVFVSGPPGTTESPAGAYVPGPYTALPYLSWSLDISPQVCYGDCTNLNDRLDCTIVNKQRCTWLYNSTIGANDCVFQYPQSNLTLQSSNGTLYGCSYNSPSGTYTGFPSTGHYCIANPNNDTLLAWSVYTTSIYCNDSSPMQVYSTINYIYIDLTPGAVFVHATKIYTIINNPTCTPYYSINSAPMIWTVGVYNQTFKYVPPSAAGSAAYTVTSCDAQVLRDMMQYFWPSADLSSVTPAQLCLQTTGLVYALNETAVVRTFTDTTEASAWTGVFADYPYIGPMPHCMWEFSSKTCQAFDSIYSSVVPDYLFCQDRIIRQSNVGACITSPATSFVDPTTGQAVGPRCASVQRPNDNTINCVPYTYDSYPSDLPPLVGLGPYDTLMPDGSGQSIRDICVQPGAVCYFEPSPQVVGGTTQWYQFAQNTSLSYPCEAYSTANDVFYCQTKTYLDGVPQCVKSGALCVETCASHNNDSIGCVGRLPFDTCYTQLLTGLCLDNNFQWYGLPVCQDSMCASASTICNLFQNNMTNCMNIPECIWYDYLFDTTNGTYPTCAPKNENILQECVDPSTGDILSFCTVSDLTSLENLIDQAAGTCNVPTGLSGPDGISLCVTQIDAISGLHCIYSSYASKLQICTSPISDSLALFDSQFAPTLSRTSITFAQYKSSLAQDTNIQVTMTHAQLVATILRPEYVVPVTNIKGNGITTVPDTPDVFHACPTNYTSVWRWCCLTSEIGSSGQCGPTHYVNPLSFDVLFQQVYSDACCAEAALEGLSCRNVDRSMLLSTIGMVEPLPSSPQYALDTNYCPYFLNSTDTIIDNYMLSTYVMALQAVDMNLVRRLGTYTCILPFQVGATTINEIRLDPESIDAIFNYFEIQVYDGTMFSVIEFHNINSNLEQANIDYTDLNVTTTPYSGFQTLVTSQKTAIIAEQTAKSGSSSVLDWGVTGPSVGMKITRVYDDQASATHLGFSAKQATYYAVGGSMKVRQAQPWTQTTIAPLIMTIGSTQTTTMPIYSIINDPDIGVLPKYGDSFVFGFDETNGVLISPKYDDCFSCGIGSGGGKTWCALIHPTKPYANLTDYLEICGSFDPSQFSENAQMFSHICAGGPGNCDVTNFQGIQFGANTIGKESFVQYCNLEFLYLTPILDYAMEPLANWWNTTMTQYNETYLLSILQATEPLRASAGCTAPPNNYIPYTTIIYSNDNTTIQGEDIYRTYLTEVFGLVAAHISLNTAITTAFDDVFMPLIATNNDAYCGNCGDEFGTMCLPLVRQYPRSLAVTTPVGIAKAASFYSVDLSNSNFIQATTTSNRVLITVTYDLMTPISNVEGLEALACPIKVSGATSFFACGYAQSGLSYCRVQAYNNYTLGTMQLTVAMSVQGFEVLNTVESISLGSGSNMSYPLLIYNGVNTTIQLIGPGNVICAQVSNIVMNSTLSPLYASSSNSSIEAIVNFHNQPLINDLQEIDGRLYYLENIVSSTDQQFKLNFSSVASSVTTFGKELGNVNLTVVDIEFRVNNVTTNFQNVLVGLGLSLTPYLNISIDQGGLIGKLVDNVKQLMNETAAIAIVVQDDNGRFANEDIKIENLQRNLTNQLIDLINNEMKPLTQNVKDFIDNYGLMYLIWNSVMSVFIVFNTIGNIHYFYYFAQARKQAKKLATQRFTPSPQQQQQPPPYTPPTLSGSTGAAFTFKAPS